MNDIKWGLAIVREGIQWKFVAAKLKPESGYNANLLEQRGVDLEHSQKVINSPNLFFKTGCDS